MFWQRVITALVLLPIVAGIVFYLPLSMFAAVVGTVSMIAAWEWSALAGLKSLAQRYIFTSVLALAECLLLYFSPPMPFWPSMSWPQFTPEWPLLILCAAALFWLLVPALVAHYPRAMWWRRWAGLRFIIGWITLLGMWVGVLSLRRIAYLDEPIKGARLIFWLLLIVWAADTGAYLAGKTFGKHKLAPQVSPGKTWEGFFGGLLLSLLVGAVGSYLWPIDDAQRLLFLVCVLLTVLASVYGDLLESLAKREAGLKDSGTLFPGHGGMLDRIDSLIAAAPVFALSVMVLELR